jgi:hypothetical protein
MCVNCGLPATSPIAQTRGAVVCRMSQDRSAQRGAIIRGVNAQSHRDKKSPDLRRMR